MALTQSEKLGLGALSLAALGFLVAGAKMAPGASVKVPQSQTEDQVPFTPPPDRPEVGPAVLAGGYVFTPHRYPASCGNDIGVLIHRGWSTAALPTDDDTLWMSQPPSEAIL